MKSKKCDGCGAELYRFASDRYKRGVTTKIQLKLGTTRAVTVFTYCPDCSEKC